MKTELNPNRIPAKQSPLNYVEVDEQNGDTYFFDERAQRIGMASSEAAEHIRAELNKQAAAKGKPPQG